MPKKRSRAATKIAYSESDSEYDDEIQTYHKQKDKILLDSDHGNSDETEEEEVYRLEESDSEDDEEIDKMEQQLRQIRRNKVKGKLGSDIEEDSASDQEAALPDSRAWGSKVSWFMGGDVRDNKIILSGEEDEAGAAAMEEADIEKIEKRQMERMSEEDYLPPSMMMKLKKMEEKEDKKQKTTMSTEAKEKKSKKKGKKTSDQTTMEAVEKIKVSTKAQKGSEFERLKELHPEYAPLVNDFGAKLRELEQIIVPLMGLVKKDKITGSGATYLKMKYHIISNYLICGGFYMYLMAKKTQGIHQHPVMKRLVELQQFYNRLIPLDKRVKADLDTLLERLRRGKSVGQVVCTGAQDHEEEGEGVPTSAKTSRKQKVVQEEGVPPAKKRKVKSRQDSESDSKDDEDENDEDGDQQDELGDDEDDELGRRAITREMEKNKGLTAHRKKELKNPRVKHRKKYRRALIRRKGQVRDFKPPKHAYSGEMTGIRAGIVRSRKLK